MASSPRSKTNHLSLIQGNGEGTVSAFKVIGLQSLTEEQKRIADRYIEFSDSSGVVLGALTGSDNFWDIRPIIFEDGDPVIIRTTNPSLVLESARFNQIKSQVLGFMSWLKHNGSVVSFGESHGQIWFKRNFYEHILSDTRSINSVQPLTNPLQACQRLIVLLDSLHSAGIVHGHLCPSNVAITHNSLVLLDAGLHDCGFIGEELRCGDIAPEVVNGHWPDFKSDVYGLGLILKKISNGSLPAALERFIQVLTSERPELRPDLSKVKEFFNVAIEERVKTTPKQLPHVGKIISAPEIFPPLPKPEPARKEVVETTPQPQQQGTRPAVNLVEAEPIKLEASNEELAPKKTELVESQSSAKPNPFSWYLVWGGIIILTTLLVILKFPGLFRPSREDFDPVTYWNSGQPSLMLEVAKEALDYDNLDAQQTIASYALDQNAKILPKVHRRLLAIVLNPEWEATLSDTDRKTAIGLALGELYPKALIELPALVEVHPAIAYAVAASIDEATPESPTLSVVPISHLTDLPSPYNEPYTLLEKQGIKTAGNPAVIALSHILSLDISDQALTSYLKDGVGERLRALVPMVKESAVFRERLFEALRRIPLTQSLARWFDAEKAAEWNTVDGATKIAIISGVLPEQQLSREQYADLLQFPLKHIKEQAAIATAQLSSAEPQVIAFLASKKNLLTRAQTIFLIPLFELKTQDEYPVVNAWFSFNPDPAIVLKVLSMRTQTKENDLFNMEASRYLLNRNPEVDFEDIKQLSVHPEALARVFAYSKLNPENKMHAELLKKMAVVEPSERIREEIKNKLNSPVLPPTEQDTFTPLE